MKNRLVFIEWEDSYGCSSRWQDIDPSATPSTLICNSVGWIVQKSKKCIVLVPHITASADVATRQGCGDMTIPTASILRVLPLSIGKRQSAV